ncbi:MAG TPA: hypothetical protein VGD78_06240, partial [Chthoniobacterales bacterium]
ACRGSKRPREPALDIDRPMKRAGCKLLAERRARSGDKQRRPALATPAPFEEYPVALLPARGWRFQHSLGLRGFERTA